MKGRRTGQEGVAGQMSPGAADAGFAQPWGNDAMQALMRGGEGPLGAALEACFGVGVGAIGFGALDPAAYGAEALTTGSEVHLGALRLDDLHGMEVLGHEVAHALAGGGSGETLLPTESDPGEHAADRGGRTFARWVGSGMATPAPSIAPARGGRAEIHRFEAPEHADAVDGALERAKTSGDPALVDKGEQASAILDPTKKIQLANGAEVTPGEITAMMGDHYGVFGDDGKLDVKASYAQLNSADPDEMKAILDLVHKEQRGETVLAADWDEAEAGRKGKKFVYTDPDTGVTKEFDQLQYVDLAKRNHGHFSGPDMEGENNMGIYTDLHRMALEEAQRQSELPEGERDLDQLRAMEAAADHYLTDRHAGGHLFDKRGVMDASGCNGAPGPYTDLSQLGIDGIMGDGATANTYAKHVHDEMNEEGVPVANANGESWDAYGDGHWEDADNADNRLRTTDSVVSSAAELQDVLDGNRTAYDVEDDGYAAHRTVPEWSQERQDDAEHQAQHTSTLETVPPILWEQGKGWAKQKYEDVGRGAKDAWNGLESEYRNFKNLIRGF